MGINTNNAPEPEELLHLIKEDESNEPISDKHPLDDYLSVILRLKEDGYSWRRIAEKFTEYGLKVSHATLYGFVMSKFDGPEGFDYYMRYERQEEKQQAEVDAMAEDDEMKDVENAFGPYDPDR